MTKKELVEQFKQNMPNFTGTEQEKQIKTALYIYIELGKKKCFDEKKVRCAWNTCKLYFNE